MPVVKLLALMIGDFDQLLNVKEPCLARDDALPVSPIEMNIALKNGHRHMVLQNGQGSRADRHPNNDHRKI